MDVVTGFQNSIFSANRLRIGGYTLLPEFFLILSRDKCKIGYIRFALCGHLLGVCVHYFPFRPHILGIYTAEKYGSGNFGFFRGEKAKIARTIFFRRVYTKNMWA